MPSKKPKANVVFEIEQMQQIRELAKKKHLSVANLVRIAVLEYCEKTN
jgi:hypothetical protein